MIHNLTKMSDFIHRSPVLELVTTLTASQFEPAIVKKTFTLNKGKLTNNIMKFYLSNAMFKYLLLIYSPKENIV